MLRVESRVKEEDVCKGNDSIRMGKGVNTDIFVEGYGEDILHEAIANVKAMHSELKKADNVLATLFVANLLNFCDELLDTETESDHLA